MSAAKYQALIGGRAQLVSGLQASAGVANGGSIVALRDDGLLDESLFPPDVIKDNARAYVGFEALAAGAYVNIFLDTSVTPNVWKMRNADYTNDRVAHGYVKVAVASAASGTIFFGGVNPANTGLVAGRVWLGAGGAPTQVVPQTVAAAKIHQLIGYAVSATEVETEFGEAILL